MGLDKEDQAEDHPEALTWISRAPPKVVFSYTLLMDTHHGPLSHVCFQSGYATGVLRRVRPQRGSSRRLLAEGGPEACRGFKQKPMLPGGRRLAGRQLALLPETSIIFRQSRWLPTWCDFTGSGGPLPSPKIPPPPASFYSSLR